MNIQIALTILRWFMHVFHLNRNSLTHTTASASTLRSNLFIQIHPELIALGTSPIAKLQIHLFISPLQLVSFQLEYLGHIPFVVSLSKSKTSMQLHETISFVIKYIMVQSFLKRKLSTLFSKKAIAKNFLEIWKKFYLEQQKISLDSQHFSGQFWLKLHKRTPLVPWYLEPMI